MGPDEVPDYLGDPLMVENRRYTTWPDEQGHTAAAFFRRAVQWFTARGVTVVRVLTEYSQVLQLRRPALMLLTLLMVQLSLGFGSWLTRVEWGHDALQPLAPTAPSHNRG